MLISSSLSKSGESSIHNMRTISFHFCLDCEQDRHLSPNPLICYFSLVLSIHWKKDNLFHTCHEKCCHKPQTMIRGFSSTLPSNPSTVLQTLNFNLQVAELLQISFQTNLCNVRPNYLNNLTLTNGLFL